MSIIAIIDDRIHENHLIHKRISKRFKYSNHNIVEVEAYHSDKYSHGTLCAKVLEMCGREYEIISIQLCDNMLQTPVNVNALNAALQFCQTICVDIISMSVGTSRLSETLVLDKTIRELSEKGIVMVAAIDNNDLYTLPASYPQVIGVRCDRLNSMPSLSIAYDERKALGAQVVANCSDVLPNRTKRIFPSNSLAVPVVVAKCNEMINQGIRSFSEIILDIKNNTVLTTDIKLFDEKTDVNKNHKNIEIPHICFVTENSAELSKFKGILDYLSMEYGYEGICFSFWHLYDDIRFHRISVMEESSFFDYMGCHTTADLFLSVVEKTEVELLESLVDIDIFVCDRKITLDMKSESPCIMVDQMTSVEELCKSFLKFLL